MLRKTVAFDKGPILSAALFDLELCHSLCDPIFFLCVRALWLVEFGCLSIVVCSFGDVILVRFPRR